MERRIGEKFEFEGKTLKADIPTETNQCEGCWFYRNDNCHYTCDKTGVMDAIGPCTNIDRTDGNNIIYKEVYE